MLFEISELILAVEGIAPLLDWVKTGAKKEVKEWKE